MKRKICNTLLEWKQTSNGRPAVMLDGARRVGKSYIAEEFARSEYAAFLDTPFVLHKKDVMVKDGVVYLPLYMTHLLSRRT